MFDYLIFIGRFQPFHLAHQAVIEKALKHSQSVIVLLGSAQPERTIKNMFSLDERQYMIQAAFSQAEQQRIYFAGLIDVYNDEKWTALVKQTVQAIIAAHRSDSPDSSSKDIRPKVGLIGHFKDQSSYYLALFPDWPLVELDNYFHLSATPIREQYLLGNLPTLQQVPPTTLAFLQDFQQTPTYQALQQQAKSAIN